MTDRKAWRLTGAFAMIVGFIGVSVNSERALTTDQLVGLVHSCLEPSSTSLLRS